MIQMNLSWKFKFLVGIKCFLNDQSIQPKLSCGISEGFLLPVGPYNTPSHVWTECSFCTFPMACFFITHTVTVSVTHTHWVHPGSFIYTKHHTTHSQYVSQNVYFCCTNDVFFCSFPQYYQINSINIWWFLSAERNRCTLTVNSCTVFFFLSDLCVYKLPSFLL